MKLELTFKEIFKQNSCTNAYDVLKFWFRIQFFKFFRIVGFTTLNFLVKFSKFCEETVF